MDFSLNSNKLLISITKWLILAMILIIPIQIIIFVLIPMPETTLSWLELFHSSPILGMLHISLHVFMLQRDIFGKGSVQFNLAGFE